MAASIIDGTRVSSAIKQNIQHRIALETQRGRRPPGLAVILIGADPASTIYIRHKEKACLQVGILSFSYHLPLQTTEAELLLLIDKLNNAIEIDGILVQLPLPKHIHTAQVLEHINPNKDVDGFHPYNLGRLAQGNPNLRPCTPAGIMALFSHYEIPLSGKQAVVIGASNIVGRPMALELLGAKATVTICHSQTQDLEQHVRQSDIVVIATGVRNRVDTRWLHANHIIIDVGIHRLDNNTLCGDIDYHTAQDIVAWITPVPGGVGPMTIAMLLQNTQLAWINDQ